MEQQARRAPGRGGRRGSRIFRIDLVEEGQHRPKERVRLADGQPGVEAIEGGVVGGGAEERQADVPAHEQIGGEVPFEVGVGTGVGPGADDLGADQGVDGKRGWSTRSRVVIVVAARGDHGGGVIELGEADERMVGTLDQQALVDQGTDPREDEREKTLEQGLHHRGEIGQRGERVSGRRW